MWERLYELHAKEQARSITEVEWQEMRGIELSIGRRSGEESSASTSPLPPRSALREAIYLLDPFGRLCD